MVAKRDLYEVLGVSKDASDADIMINMGMLHTIQTQDFLVAVLVAVLKALVVSEVKDSLEVIQVDSKIFSIHSLVAAVVVVEIVLICHVKGQIYNMSWT